MALALFDLDDTLINGDSASLWIKYLVENDMADAAILDTEERLMREYHAGTLDAYEYVRHFHSPIKGRHHEDVAETVTAFVAQIIRPLIMPAAYDCLARHQKQNDTVVIISATSEVLVKPIARSMNVDHVIAIRPGLVDGRYTGRSVGTLSFQEGKVHRLNEWLDKGAACRKESLKGSHFYSDSRNDLPLLEMVENPVATNPDPVLHEIATKRGWSIREWKEV